MPVFSRLVSILLLLCWSTTLFAQYPDYLVYQLTDKEAELLHQETVVFLLPGQKAPEKKAVIHLRKPIRSFKHNAPFHLADLPPGHYIRAYANPAQMAYSYNQLHPFTRVQLLPNTQTSDLILAHPTVSSQELGVSFKGKKVSFQVSRGTFQLSGRKINGLLAVTCPEGRFFFTLQKKVGRKQKHQFGYAHHLNQVMDHVRRHRRNQPYHAYMVFSQPRYRPGDTLKLKIFAVSKKGEALEEDLNLKFGRTHLGRLTPFRPGAYRFEMVLHDSLDWRLDARHTFQAFTAEKDQYVTGHFFQYEDYLLDEITYELRTTKSVYEPGEDVQVIAQGKDPNGLSIADGEVELTVSYGNLLAPPDQKVYIPYLITEKTEALSQDPAHRITFPDSLFPKAHIQYYIRAKFRNSNNELQERAITFTIQKPKNQPYIHSWRGDTLILSPSFGWTDSVATTLVLSGRHGEIKREEVVLPVVLKIASDVSGVKLAQGKRSWSVPILNGLPGVSLEVFRVGDSAKVRILNPNGLTLNYRIGTDKKQLTEGILTQAKTFGFYDPKGSHFTAFVQGHWRGYLRTLRQHLPYFDKRLSIEVDQPRKVLPGEKVEMTVTVTDEMGQPVPAVDLTAMGRNVTFPEQHLPEMYSSATPKSAKVASYWHRINPETRYQKNTYLDAAIVNHLQLDSLTRYRMRYPDSLEVNYTQLDDTKMAEFAPFVMAKGNTHPIYFIYCNGQMIYYSGANSQQPFAFSLPEGTYSFTLRTHYASYTLPKVKLIGGFKLDLSINALNLPKGVTSKLIPSTLTAAEAQDLSQYFIWVKPTWDKQQQAYIWQAGRAFALQGGARNGINPGYACVGPLPLGEATFVVPGAYGRYFQVKGGDTYEFDRWNLTKGLAWQFAEGMPLPNPPYQSFGGRALRAETIQLAARKTILQQPRAIVGHVTERNDVQFNWINPPAQVAFRHCDDPYNYWVANPTRLPEGCYCFLHRARNGSVGELDSVWIKKDHLLAFPKMLIPYRDSVFADSMWDSRYSIGYQGEKPFFLNQVYMPKEHHNGKPIYWK